METKKARPRNNGEWVKRSRALKKRSKAANAPCWICFGEIDYDDTHGPLSFTADHMVEIAAGGAVVSGADIRPAHRSCNSKRSNTREARIRQGRTVVPEKQRKVMNHRMMNTSASDYTTVAPSKRAEPERWRTRGGVLTTIDWDSKSTPLYRK